MACKLGLKDVVYVLLKNKADVTVRTSNGKNPLDFAIDYHHEDCANVLIEHESWRNSLSNAVIIDGTGYFRLAKTCMLWIPSVLLYSKSRQTYILIDFLCIVV